MKYKWLNNESNSKIIIFFNGWGMDGNVIKHLISDDYDVLMFYDYNTLETNFDFELLNVYAEKFLVAWSMGVMVAGICSQKLPSLTRSIAINGTQNPIHEEFGIHPKIYDLTIKGFNEKGRERFINSMFDNQVSSLPLSSERDIQEQLSELIALKNYRPNESFKYNKILISDRDKIIPTKSQVSYWRIEPNLEGGHCPFFKFSKWSELL